MKVRHFAAAIAIGVWLVAGPPVRGIILYSTGDPNANTSAPGGSLAGSGWQFEGTYGNFLATAVGPHHFLTAKHIGTPSNTINYRGTNYTIAQTFDDPGSDLRVFQVNGSTLPAYAPLYSGNGEVGHTAVVFGRGTQRGGPVVLQGTLKGWNWGPVDTVQRWGQNQISEAVGYTIYATFDQNGGSNECHLSTGDSGGGVFINDGGTWKLAGVNLTVDEVEMYPGGPAYDAALFDARGFYNMMGQLITGGTAQPTGFYATRVSAEIQWLFSVVFPDQPPGGSQKAEMISPTPGTTFLSSSVTFSWTPGNTTSYKLFLGKSKGKSNIYKSSVLTVHSLTVNNIPTNGHAVWVRLSSHLNGKWKHNDYHYTAAN